MSSINNNNNNNNETEDDPFQGVTVKALHLKAGNKAISKKKKGKTLQPQQLQQQLLDRTSLHSTPSPPPPESINLYSGLTAMATGIKKTKAELMFEAAQRKRVGSCYLATANLRSADVGKGSSNG